MKFLRDVDALCLDREGVPSEEHFNKGDTVDVQVSEADASDMVRVQFDDGRAATLCREDVEFNMFTDVAKRN